MENSTIEWTNNTFNPWVGCTEVSPACDHCYASTIALRFGLAEWGPDAIRRIASGDYLRQPSRWQRRASKSGKRERVFCGSMCDIFEGRRDQSEALTHLWRMIQETPNLDWQLLTKRPANIRKLVPWRPGEWPENVWFGTTIENQEWADRRIPHLLQVPGSVRFVSVEPMLGPVDLRPHLGTGEGKINWVICGGESGPQARGADEMITWYRDLRDQCRSVGVPFFFKQFGNFRFDGDQIIKLSKKNPDHSLDGILWQQFPR